MSHPTLTVLSKNPPGGRCQFILIIMPRQPIIPQVADAIEPYLRQSHLFGNPSSSHIYGQRAHDVFITSVLRC